MSLLESNEKELKMELPIAKQTARVKRLLQMKNYESNLIEGRRWASRRAQIISYEFIINLSAEGNNKLNEK